MSTSTPEPMDARLVTVESRDGGVHAVRFLAMGCPCEVLVETPDADQARHHAQAAIDLAWRIERQYSRYRPDSEVSRINASAGDWVQVSAEAERLLDYAGECHRISDGLFDITCGILRRAWRFDGSSRVPGAADIQALLPLIGFDKLARRAGAVCLPAGMEIDLGGLAKEYAVDCAVEALGEDLAVLVNFGGDLGTRRAPARQPWQVGVENPAGGPGAVLVLEVTRGALATSGDAHRFVELDGRRYGHILDPRTGWPVEKAPRSVTVAGNRCIEAGTLSTLAQLHGRGAESFLEEMGATYWCLR